MFKFSGKQPANLGAKNGKLALVVNKPNNVSSQADLNDGAHYVAPFKFTGDAAAAFQKLVKLVQGQPRANVVTQDGQYLHAEFSTPLMGFVDDAEFLLAPEQTLIHVRSAARLGYSDLGVNRKRVESLRAQFAVNAPEQPPRRV
jgi:uncharacterized protein (DUF1499 family)